jgi:2-keto-myo-inositol isomerase
MNGMKPCISEATTLSSAFADDVNGYTDGGCHATEVWLTKLETHLGELQRQGDPQ